MPHSTAQDVTPYVNQLFQLWFYWLGIRDHPNQGIGYIFSSSVTFNWGDIEITKKL